MRRTSILLLAFLLTASAAAAELQVSAAASLTNAMTEIGRAFERSHATRVRFNFGGSDTLAMQIREGAPVDVFVSADELQMDRLDRSGLVRSQTRRSILSNVLVIVVPSDSRRSVHNATDLGSPAVSRVAIANPDRVPAGRYAEAYLAHAGVWPAVRPKMVPTENVRATLAAVESGNVDAGIVYRTDAMMSKRVRVAATIEGRGAPRISYPAAVLRDSASPSAAAQFVNYLTSRDARRIFSRYGFIVR